MIQQYSPDILGDLAPTIKIALGHYGNLGNGQVRFDHSKASHLKYVEGKPTPRSQTPVLFGKVPIGDLFVIGFAPLQGTGDNNTYTQDELSVGMMATGQYEKMSRSERDMLLPRSKRGVRAEVSLPILAAEVDMNNPTTLVGSTIPLIGNLSLLGAKHGEVVEIARLGQHTEDYHRALADPSEHIAPPTVTLTVGYHGDLDSRGPITPIAGDFERRFSDPHAVFNGCSEALQVAAFLAIKDDVAAQVGLDPLRALGAVEPQLIEV